MSAGEIAVGALLFGLGWIASRFSAVAGRRTEASIDRIWSRGSKTLASRRARQAIERAASLAASKRTELERSRTGRTFVRHVISDDPGMTGTVVALDAHQPELRVSTRWHSPDGRAPREGDYATDRPVSIEWKTLVMAPADQIHFTARMVLHESSDENGWVEFEERT